ncbi:Hemolymph lipopolysaccharide-binding protein [Cryptotermes secundus]|uniref:Hemolymph lipopolysaccharide-binding protein n=1 Tax=Cryptotermes secundus TaxID=105785 RepID=A0A2J7RNJ5_9NEOP|nr:hemolymph lipopolysaccharide-binding protein [Cryptotermes secundus]PNF42388.1 Hemolymph lipopolysaccharide-binding protein [Cryptotermes secundus]PNF42389.1 Hemolymph lipopolysaccharide-binding protein [Cryptotermes secundus]
MTQLCGCVAVMCMLWCAGASADYPCPAQNSPAFKFSVTSRRNKTGHWIAQVEMEHGADQNENEVGPWKADVKQSTAKCGGIDSVFLLATVVVPPRDADTEEQKPCRKPPADYELLPGLGYYKFHTDIKTWGKARDMCENEGAHLVVINSLTEAKTLPSIWIRDVFNDWRKDAAYIGTWDPEGNGEFVTIFNETLEAAGYNKWFPDEPNFMGHCGMLRSNSLLGNTFCDEKLLFICEFKE